MTSSLTPLVSSFGCTPGSSRWLPMPALARTSNGAAGPHLPLRAKAYGRSNAGAVADRQVSNSCSEGSITLAAGQHQVCEGALFHTRVDRSHDRSPC